MYQLENQIKQSLYDLKMTNFPFLVSFFFLNERENKELMEMADIWFYVLVF